ncbi:chemotaxis protein CheD [Aquibacillus sediminis]|uniref:chemotaxis protein CheD n=1 Tax=Aquibacillus sediminis TaxID=2574734 RepID=UPI00110839A1|nr:chemotaxis protein CheD [Aquibacillus sediminis]
MNATVVKVGIADLKVAKSPELLRTSGLGSCVGVVIYDLSSKIAGLAHIMLPSSELSKDKNQNQMKYADTAIDLLVQLLIDQGAKTYAMKSKLAGGAQMFTFTSSNDTLRVGKRNTEAVLKRLEKHRIPVIAKDVGGNSGRTIEFNTDTGMLKIKTVNQGIGEI